MPGKATHLLVAFEVDPMRWTRKGVGKERWRFATDQRDGRNSAIYSVPLLHKGGVYFAAGEGQAYAVLQDTGN
jgi:outer membrane protein assembly factor BamB